MITKAVRVRARSAAMFSVLLVAAPIATAQAATTIASSANDISGNLKLLGLAAVDVDPFSAAAGSGPVAYDHRPGPVISVKQTLSIGVRNLVGVSQKLQTGLLTPTAQSLLPSQVGTARAKIDNLSLLFGTAIAGNFNTVLSLTATEIASRSLVTGNSGAAARGFTTLTGLAIRVHGIGGFTINPLLFVDPAANTTVLDALGLKIVLNEQKALGLQSATSAGVSTNAIRLIFSSYVIGGSLLSGEVVIAHSEAQIHDAMVGVPEPATWLQFILGFGIVGLIARRRRVVAI